MRVGMDGLRPGDPEKVGGYRLLGRLGAGGMGQVFLGDSPSGRKVAVKLIHPDHADAAQFRERFAREIEAAKKVGGFHTAPVVDADPDADPPWMVTAYIDGPSLGEAVARGGSLSLPRLRALGAGLAEGLAAIHACGLVHRDLKPGNVILAGDGPRIIDFGIVRALGEVTMTTAGAVVGTATYMSPEQVRGHPVGPASDVFALGSTLAFAATGRPPFGTEPIGAVVFRIAAESPDLTGVPEEGRFRDLVAACLAKEPAARPSVAAILTALTESVPVAPGPGAPAPVRVVPHLPPPVPAPPPPGRRDTSTQRMGTDRRPTHSGGMVRPGDRGTGTARPDLLRSRTLDRDEEEPPPWANLPPVRPARPPRPAGGDHRAGPGGPGGRPVGPGGYAVPGFSGPEDRDPAGPANPAAPGGLDQDAEMPSWAGWEGPEADGEAEVPPAAPRGHGRARRAAARRRRRWLITAGGALGAAVTTVVLLTGSRPGPAPVTPGALITTFQPGELRQVPDACDVVPSATVQQYLPGKAKVASPLPVNGSAESACNWTIDKPPVYRLMELNMLAYAPNGLASGDGSATFAAVDAYDLALQTMQSPPKHSPAPRATVSTLTGFGNQAFSALQVFRVGGAVTDVATVMVRYHNVVVTVTLNGLEHSNQGSYGPVSQSQLAAAALAFARAAEASLR